MNRGGKTRGFFYFISLSNLMLMVQHTRNFQLHAVYSVDNLALFRRKNSPPTKLRKGNVFSRVFLSTGGDPMVHVTITHMHLTSVPRHRASLYRDPSHPAHSHLDMGPHCTGTPQPRSLPWSWDLILQRPTPLACTLTCSKLFIAVSKREVRILL